jgi:para-nitrobenzyl esterase
MNASMGNVSPGLAGGVVKNSDSSAVKIPPAKGAVHSAEIEYAMGNLSTNKVYAWNPDDYKVSRIMQEYFANFIKNGNPDGPGLPTWPAANKGNNVQVMHIDVTTKAEPETHRDRYIFMDQQRKK